MSGLARMVRVPRSGPTRSRDPFGLCVHTTGSTIVERAIARGVDPLEHAVEYYLQPESFFPTYVGGWDGQCVQLAGEAVKTKHVGFAERARYLEDDWEKSIPRALYQAWREAWPAYPSPAHLFPGGSPNDAYIGIELVPLVNGVADQPAYPGSCYTLPQHQLVVLLALDLAERYGWPEGWQRGPQLLGHEDLNPIARHSNGLGWDPGALRPRPWFAWRWVRELAAGLEPGPISP